MNKGFKRTIGCLTATVMAALSLTGCSPKVNSNDTTAPNAASKAMGRYVESEIKLPFDKDYDSILLFDESDHPYLVRREFKDGILTVMKCTLNADQSWKKDTIASIPLENYKDIYAFHYMTGPDNTAYITFITSGEENLQKFYAQQGNDWIEINFEGWNKKNEEYNYYETPSSIGVLSNGLIIAKMDGSFHIYDNKTGKITKNMDDLDCTKLMSETVQNDYIISTQMDPVTYQPTGILLYQVMDGTKKEIPIPNSSDDNYDNVFFVNNDDLYLINKDGIQIYPKDGSMWQIIVDGCLTSLYIPYLGVQSALLTKDQTYYLLCNYSEDVHLLQYHFDETVSAVPDKELSIYSLKDNPLIRQAIVSFQQKHPDVKVTLNAVSTPSDTTAPEDYIRALNTTLLAGQGDDLLVLDGLPYESYQQKDVLEDITDIIKPLIDNQKVLSNVFDAFDVDGSYYYAPAKISPLMIYGNGDSAESCTTLDSMITYAASHKERPIVGNISSTTLIQDFLPPYLNAIHTPDGKISTQGLRTFLEQLQKLYEITGGISSITNPEEAQNAFGGIWSLASDLLCCIEPSDGYAMDTFNYAMVDFVKGSFSNFEDSFRASTILGINKATKKMELAKEFVALLYNEQVQSSDFMDGNPVNLAALNHYYDIVYESAETDVKDQNGNYSLFQIHQPSKETLTKMIDICKSTKNLIREDSVLINKISTAAEDLLAGKTSLDDTVSSLSKELSMYAQE